jgi:hypothetical protein
MTARYCSVQNSFDLLDVCNCDYHFHDEDNVTADFETVWTWNSGIDVRGIADALDLGSQIFGLL